MSEVSVELPRLNMGRLGSAGYSQRNKRVRLIPRLQLLHDSKSSWHTRGIRRRNLREFAERNKLQYNLPSLEK